MKILLTNDDGITAPGIRALWQSLSTIGDVVVAAPAREQSATSHSITVFHPIWVDEHHFDDPKITGWRIGGTPADSVKIALDALLGYKPDIVVSGINYGPNLGTDVMYSGTVSAAIEGAMHGIPAIAISLATDDEPDFGPAADFCLRLVQQVMKNGLRANSLLNVNVPAISAVDIKGTVVTRLGVVEYDNAFERRQDPRGRTYYWMVGTVIDSKNETDTDVAAIRDHMISVTPIHFDLTDYCLLENLQRWRFD